MSVTAQVTDEPMDNEETYERPTVGQLLGVFLKLGLTGYGGPAVTMAMMEEEVVSRRKWMPRTDYMDILSISNLVPGPNAAELAIYVGYRTAGWLGFILSGLAFVLPGSVMSGILGWFYVRYGSLPGIEPWLVGIKPAVVSVIAMALWRMGNKSITSRRLAIVGVLALVFRLLGADEAVAMIGAALLITLLHKPPSDDVSPPTLAPALVPLAPLGVFAARVSDTVNVSLWQLGAFFLKVGALLYGGGYVLFAFLEGGLVQQFGWLTHTQLLDAIAAGQLTPGSLASTSTFIGYVLAGIPGATLATIGMFLPSFLIMLIIGPFIPALRKSEWVSRFLDAVAAAALGLMAAVALNLGATVLVSWQSIVIAVVAAVAAWRFKVASVWLVLGGSVLGRLLAFVG